MKNMLFCIATVSGTVVLKFICNTAEFYPLHAAVFQVHFSSNIKDINNAK